MGKVIAIANQKGGVGKTTTSVNLSAILGVLDKKVLMLDVDAQGNATQGVNIKEGNQKYSTFNCFDINFDIEKTIVKTEYKNLYIIPSSKDLAGVDSLILNKTEKELLLKKQIEKIKDDYDYIIIDCPPALNFITINCLAAADSILIPVQCEFYALEGVAQLLTTIKLIKEKINPRLRIEGLLPTMSQNTNLSKDSIAELKKFFGEGVYNTAIRRNIKLAESPSYGKPVYYYDELCAGTQDYYDLAQEILKGDK